MKSDNILQVHFQLITISTMLILHSEGDAKELSNDSILLENRRKRNESTSVVTNLLSQRVPSNPS